MKERTINYYHLCKDATRGSPSPCVSWPSIRRKGFETTRLSFIVIGHTARDYGEEAIEILLQVMENHCDDLVVILAGYKDRMDTFFQSNPGLSSRIAPHLQLSDCTLLDWMHARA